MSGKHGLNPDDAKVLEELEKLIGKEIPKIDDVNPNWDPFIHGVVIKGDQITGLALFNCGIKELPDSLSNLKSLNTLFIKTNKLKTLPDSLMGVKTLQALYVIENELEELPESIGQLESLKLLSLSLNKLEQLPATLGQLKALTELDVADNKLKELPDSFGQLTSLHTLHINSNKLKKIPVSILDLPLSFVNAMANKLDKDSKGLLKQLEEKGVSVSY